MISIAISFHSNEELKAKAPELKAKGLNGGRRRGLQKILGSRPFQSEENFLFDIKRVLQKGHFRSFAERGRNPDPQYSLSYAPG